MNSFGDKVKYFFGLDTEEDVEVEEETKKSEDRPKITEQNTYQRRYKSGDDIEYEKKKIVERKSTKKEVKKMSTEGIDSSVVICKYAPISHDESVFMIDDFKSGRPVIVNFENTQDFVSEKIINICEGAAYALNADISKLSTSIYIIVPEGIDIKSHIEKDPNKDENDVHTW